MHLDPDTIKDALSILNNEQIKNIVSPTTKAMGESLKDLYDATIGENMRNVVDRLNQLQTRDVHREDFHQTAHDQHRTHHRPSSVSTCHLPHSMTSLATDGAGKRLTLAL